MMRKLLAISFGLTLLTGCAFSTTMTMDNQGRVTGTVVFGVPKSALAKVTTVEQWSQILSENNFPSPGPTATEGTSASPAPSASCSPGEDALKGLWTYGCDISGDISALSATSETTSTSSLTFTRDGQNLTVSLNPSDSSNDLTAGLKGISLMTMTSTITLPGNVQSVSEGVTKVDEHTASFVTDENQKGSLTATYQLSDAPTNQIGLVVSAIPTYDAISSQNCAEITVTLASPAPGIIELFDGTTSIGTHDYSFDTTSAQFTQLRPNSGQHNYRAVFSPTDWWNYVQSSKELSATYVALGVVTKPKISGIPKVGKTLSVSSGSWSTSGVAFSYQWTRNGLAIPGATKKSYKVTATDKGKSISVRVTGAKRGKLSKTVATTSVKAN